MQIPLTAYYTLSLAASFAISFLLLAKPRSIIFLLALAVVLFVLFGPLALPAFFIAVGLRGLLREREREEREKILKKNEKRTAFRVQGLGV